MAKKEKRFQTEFKESDIATESRVIVDSQTGVQYLFFFNGGAGGMTLLVDTEGRPLLSPTYMR